MEKIKSSCVENGTKEGLFIQNKRRHDGCLSFKAKFSLSKNLSKIECSDKINGAQVNDYIELFSLELEGNSEEDKIATTTREIKMK